MRALEVPLCNYDLTYSVAMKFKAVGASSYGASSSLVAPLTYVPAADQITSLVVEVQDTNCASIGDYEITITGTSGSFVKTAVFFVTISKDCRCNVLSESSPPAQVAKYTYLIDFVGADALYSVNFDNTVPSCDVVYTITSSALPVVLLVGGNMDVLEIDSTSTYL
jgi:hypothetical protein